MIQRLELQPAYVIHAKPYRDTSFIVRFLTPDAGVVAGIARGQRQKKSSQRALLNPFIPLLISLQGKRDLKLVTHLEASGVRPQLLGPSLFSGLYLNELLVRLLPEADPHPSVYTDYCNALEGLSGGAVVEDVLRHFETRLLAELGYAISWREEAGSDSPIRPDAYYRLDCEAGFVPVGLEAHDSLYCGEQILAVASDAAPTPQSRRLAKRVNRALLQPLLGSRPLQSRALFKSP